MVEAHEVDQNLYSRQIGVFGMETMGKLVQLDVLIVGMKGLGVEIAKNLILAGPRSVTIFDPEAASIADLSTNVSGFDSINSLFEYIGDINGYLTVNQLSCLQYYLSAQTVGHSRANACISQLSELNPYVKVNILPEASISEDVLKRFHVVVVSNTPREKVISWNKFCHAQNPPIGFIHTDIYGASGFAFVDFGDNHVIRDKNGEAVKSAVVVGLTKGEKTVILTHDGKRHGFDDGDSVEFHEADIPELASGKIFKITNTRAHSFELEGVDSSNWPDFTNSFSVEQVKVPFSISHKTLDTYIPAPGELITPDFGKFGISEQLFYAFQAVEYIRTKSGSFPPIRYGSSASVQQSLFKEILQVAESILHSYPEDQRLVEKIDHNVLLTVSQLASIQLAPLCAFFGGIVAQEVVKITGKFTPLSQMLCLDAFEVLPEYVTNTHYDAEADSLTKSDSFVTEMNSNSSLFKIRALPPSAFDTSSLSSGRYAPQAQLLSVDTQKNLMNKSIFLVGSGALGCEFLKNFAVMGVGCGPSGRITVTDMDRIEVSNLNRQFLFRSKDVGHPKSTTAAAAAAAMNPDLKIEALETPVGEDTESTFDDAFWSSTDIVVNALDNVKARQYVDSRCVFFSKPLLESGTLGTKANTQAVIPFLTETYSDGQDPPEDSIPMCTLRNFPHLIEHCIEWSRDVFEGSFAQSVKEAEAFVANPSGWIQKARQEPHISLRRSKLDSVLKCLEVADAATFESCAISALTLFHQHFYLAISQLLHSFPVDYIDKETGQRFWNGTKRAPTAIKFDPSEPLHMAYYRSAVPLFCSNYAVPVPSDFDSEETVNRVLQAAHLPEFVPKDVRIKTSDTDNTVEGADDDLDACQVALDRLNALAAEAEAGKRKFPTFVPAEFEKDDDTNHHIAFITAAANVRARNYRIKEASFHQVKMIAGKIIPAIATTTCAVTGLVAIELLKLVRPESAPAKLELYRNAFMNIAINMFSFGEPGAPVKTVSLEYDPVIMGPLKARPEGFSRWDKLIIKEGDLTCAEFTKYFKDTMQLDLQMITAGKNILYNPLLFRAHKEHRGPKKLSEVYEEITGSKIPAGKNYLVLDLSLSDDEGDVMVPLVQYFFR